MTYNLYILENFHPYSLAVVSAKTRPEGLKVVATEFDIPPESPSLVRSFNRAEVKFVLNQNKPGVISHPLSPGYPCAA